MDRPSRPLPRRPGLRRRRSARHRPTTILARPRVSCRRSPAASWQAGNGGLFMTIENEGQLDGLKHVGRIVAQALELMRDKAEPGMTTAELDAIGAEHLEKEGARSAPQLAYDF